MKTIYTTDVKATGGRNGYEKSENSVLNLAVQKVKITTGATSVNTKVSIGQLESRGCQLALELQVTIPKVSLEEVKSPEEKAHQIYPCSNVTRGHIQMILKTTNH